MKAHFKHLPQSLQVLCLTYGAGPFAFLAACLINVPFVVVLPGWYMGVAALLYGVGPWTVAALLLWRSRSFLYAFAVWGLALIGLAFSAPRGLPGAFVLVHATFAMTMVMTALVLVNRDLLLPLMFPERRGWRLAPRVTANQRAKLTLPRFRDADGEPRHVQVMIEDCSLSGIAVYASEDQLTDALEDAVKGEAALVSCVLSRRLFEVPMSCMWQSQAAGVMRMGLKARDQDLMGEFFAALQPVQATRSMPRRLQARWGGRSLRRALNYTLAVVLLSLMLLPPLFLDNGPAGQVVTALQSYLHSDGAVVPRTGH